MFKARALKFASLGFLALLSACCAVEQPCTPTNTDNAVYVVEGGWHAEIGIRVAELKGDLQFYKNVFPGADTLMIGYGKRTFFTAEVKTPAEYILGPFPGPAVIHIVGLRGTPIEAYPDQEIVTLALSPDGARKMSEFIWNDLAKSSSGKPKQIALSTNPQGAFYDAESDYNLLHTCNTWAAEALQASGLPLSGEGIIFSGQIMSEAHEAGEKQCASSH